MQQEQPLKEISVESLLPLNDHAIDLEKADSRRRSNRRSKGDEESKEDEKDWNKHLSETSLLSIEEGKYTSVLNELPEKGREMLKAAALLGGSFDMGLLEAVTSTSGGVLSIYLEMALHREIIKENENGLYSFASEARRTGSVRAHSADRSTKSFTCRLDVAWFKSYPMLN